MSSFTALLSDVVICLKGFHEHVSLSKSLLDSPKAKFGNYPANFFHGMFPIFSWASSIIDRDKSSATLHIAVFYLVGTRFLT